MQQEFKGWKILFCYAVPFGHVLNKDTVKDYPLIECGTWISDDNHWMLQRSLKREDFYQLIPNTQEAGKVFFNWYSEMHGGIDYLNHIKDKLNVHIL